MMKNTAIVLAGGSGSRMKSSVKKQYLLLEGKPLLCYSLEVFQNFDGIDEIILVCGKGEADICRRLIVEPDGITKVTAIVEGGKERYHSVYEGLKAAQNCRYVLIHDGARPFVDDEMLARILQELPKCRACAAGVMVKDTIKLTAADGYVEQTLPRERLWSVQTPQAFDYTLIRGAYDRLMEQEKHASGESSVKITDDAMVAEYIAHVPVKMIEGSYSNIKITTQEDLLLAQMLLERKNCSRD